jgi:hypothetical protein
MVRLPHRALRRRQSERACDGGGLQYCVGLELVDAPRHRRWGVCNEPTACELGDTDYCLRGPRPPETSCLLDGQGGARFDDCGFTPLVLSFGADLEFSPAPARALDFSLQGPHACARADWPAPATPWLALDRDRNGSIDDGRELFGSGSMLASGSYARHGFAALAELDSDSDGAITPADAAWSDLVLWADHDADRRSSGWELLPLASFAIEAIDLGLSQHPQLRRPRQLRRRALRLPLPQRRPHPPRRGHRRAPHLRVSPADCSPGPRPVNA